MTVIENHLKIVAEMGDELQSRTVGAYERFVLRYGHLFNGDGTIPSDVTRGQMGQCFGNAALLALARPDEFVYTEGYAMFRDILPMQHAWCTDRAGNVVDPTWTTQTEYYGVLIKHKYVATRPGLSMIDDWHNDWKLITCRNPKIHLIELKKWVQAPAPETIRA